MAKSETRSPIFRFESVDIGDESSRLSRAVFVLLCVIPIMSTILFGAVDAATWTLISTAMAILSLFWLGDSWKAGGFIFNASVLQVPLIGLIAIGLIQLLPFGGETADGLLKFPPATTLSLDPYSTQFFLVRLVLYLVFFAACLTFINNDRRLKKIALLIIVFGSLMAFFGILQKLAHPEAIYGLRETPQAIPFGPFVNQHHFAAFMEMTGGIALALLFGKTTSRDSRLLLVIAVIVMGVATVFTGSRGGLLGFFAVIAFVILLNLFSRKKQARGTAGCEEAADPRAKFIIAVAGVTLIFVIFGVVLFLGENDSLLRGVGLSAAQSDISNGRAHFWPIALQIFFSHPILGAGFDAFGVAYTKFDTWNGVFRVEEAHNDYLQTLADAGLAGFICVVAYIYFLFKKGLATITNSDHGFRRDAAIGALAGCFGILIHSFFDFPLRTPSNAFFFLLLSAIAVTAIGSTGRAAISKRRA